MNRYVTWALRAVLALFVGYLLAQYAFYSFHGNDQFILLMFGFGVFFLVVAAAAKLRRLIVIVPIAYLYSFFLGLIFGRFVYQGPELINDWWIVWLYSFFFIVGVSLVVELISSRYLRRYRG